MLGVRVSFLPRAYSTTLLFFVSRTTGKEAWDAWLERRGGMDYCVGDEGVRKADEPRSVTNRDDPEDEGDVEEKPGAGGHVTQQSVVDEVIWDEGNG